MSSLMFDPIKTQAKVTDAVLVGFSGGKDSIATLDLCMRYFDRVQPFFLYLCPGLEFQEETLHWYERRYGCEIIRLPHFEVSNFMRYGSFREYDPNVPIIGITDEYNYLRLQTGITWIAAGERINDSIVRRAMIKNSGTIDMKRARFYPIANWTKREVLQYIKHHKLKLPPDSKKLGFSFKSLDGRELAYIKQAYPQDYERILKVYPYAVAAVERFDRYAQGIWQAD